MLLFLMLLKFVPSIFQGFGGFVVVLARGTFSIERIIVFHRYAHHNIHSVGNKLPFRSIPIFLSPLFSFFGSFVSGNMKSLTILEFVQIIKSFFYDKKFHVLSPNLQAQRKQSLCLLSLIRLGYICRNLYFRQDSSFYFLSV